MDTRSRLALASVVAWLAWGFLLLGWAAGWVWATGLYGLLVLTALTVAAVVWENSG